MNVVDILDRKLESALTATSDRDFYLGIHSYLDVVLHTPELANYINQAEQDFHTDVQIQDDNIKVEQFNVYTAYYLPLYLRIYIPIETYKTTNEPDSQQDPVALYLLYGPKHPRSRSWNCPSMSPGTGRNQVASYSSWFKGKRPDYERLLKQLHTDLVTNYQPSEIIQPTVTTPLVVDFSTGDFHYAGTTGNLNPKTQAFRVLTTLYQAENYQADYLTLIRCLKPNTETVTKPAKQELSDVIKQLKRNLGILPQSETSAPDIFDNQKKLGYRLIFQPLSPNPE